MSIVKFGKDIPSFVRNLRRDEQWTQLELGNMLGVHAQYVSNVERGICKNPISFASLLYQVCPRDRKIYLMDLVSDSASNHAVRRMDVRRRKGGKK